jgi:ribosomal protein S18 acetylase RimI-like enzyme
MDTCHASRLNVRAAVTADLPALIALNVQVIAELSAEPPAGFRGNTAAAPDASQLDNEFKAALADDGQLLLLAELDGRLAGSALGSVEDYSDELLEAPYLTVQYVAVSPAARGQGVAQALLTALEHRARARGLSVLELRVWSNNRAAIELYVKQGYTPIEQRMAKKLG